MKRKFFLLSCLANRSLTGQHPYTPTNSLPLSMCMRTGPIDGLRAGVQNRLGSCPQRTNERTNHYRNAVLISLLRYNFIGCQSNSEFCYFAPPGIGAKCIAIFVFVSLCLFCLSVCPLAYLKNNMSKLDKIFCTCYLCGRGSVLLYDNAICYVLPVL